MRTAHPVTRFTYAHDETSIAYCVLRIAYFLCEHFMRHAALSPPTDARLAPSEVKEPAQALEGGHADRQVDVRWRQDVPGQWSCPSASWIWRARRSKPRRMSVAPAANQTRVPDGGSITP